jgi:hypothetical protein
MREIPAFARKVVPLPAKRAYDNEAFIETAVLMMSMEAYRQKRMVRWDPVTEEFFFSEQIELSAGHPNL